MPEATESDITLGYAAVKIRYKTGGYQS